PILAGTAALILTSADLALANFQFVLTVPQSSFEAKPRVIELIERAEREQPTEWPFRIHRMPAWNPSMWLDPSPPNRGRDFVEWEHATIQPKYGLKYGVEYTHTLGVAELYDYDWFFGGFPRTIDAETAKALNAKEGDSVVYYPRRAFSLWN